MSRLHIGVGSLNQTPLDWDGNSRRIVQAIKAAREQGIALLCLPELCISGYGCEDAFFSTSTQRLSLERLLEVAVLSEGIAVVLGLPLRVEGRLYNAAAFVADGALKGFVLKRALPKDGIHYEPRWFSPSRRGMRTTVQVNGARVPAGDLIFDLSGLKVGIEICEDGWIADRPGTSLAAADVDVILNPSASHFAFGKRDIREKLVVDASRSLHCVYALANMLGNEAGRIVYDGDSIIAANGALVARGPRFRFDEVVLTSATVDLERVRNRSLELAEQSDEPLVDTYHQMVECGFQAPDSRIRVQAADVPQWERSTDLKYHEFTLAVSLALFDYLRKSRSQGFVISLSGGADSSGTAVLVHAMLRFALEQLGSEEVQERLAHCRLKAGQEEKWLERLLTCVYQSTEHSSSTTRDAASGLATEIGARYLEVSISKLVELYCGLLQATMDEPLSWERHDTVLQNIQARARGPFAWMLANERNSLLLATSNRSEAAVGYTTMDGDTCGGLSPIGGIDKAFLLSWLSWIRAGNCTSLGEIRSLDAVLRQQPTAELRPASKAQTDEKDLMPYPVLDLIEGLAIRDRLSPREVLAELRDAVPEHSAETLQGWVEKFFTLWSRNQWKRERYAPSFHLDDKNLDPKTWCRFPILSGGFERELANLREKP